ncbi:MAG: hypothetical protein ACTSVV_18835 [Promethearchaeota archaeon]
MGNDDLPIVGTDKDEVGRSPIDYFSWGHVDMGIATFLLLSLINTIPSLIDKTLIYIIPYFLMLILVLIVAIVWEILENTLLLEWGFKFEGRRDSFVNALWDIIFVIIGGLYMWIVKGILVNIIMGVKGIPIFYIIGIISFIVILIAFFIGKAITK